MQVVHERDAACVFWTGILVRRKKISVTVEKSVGFRKRRLEFRNPKARPSILPVGEKSSVESVFEFGRDVPKNSPAA